jgi:hypothetical protein
VERTVAAMIVFAMLSGAMLPGIGPAAARAEKAHNGKQSRSAETVVVQPYSSVHFLVYSDLPPNAARELLKQLETLLKLVSNYWGRPPAGVLECYVAKDIAQWPEQLTSQMEPEGLEKIRNGEGVMLGVTMTLGKRMAAKARVYAAARDGIPLHEAVHGYCEQTFGRTGPQWYAEGMAELGHYWLNGKKGVNAPAAVIDYLRKTSPRTIDAVAVPVEKIGGTWQDYAWWWFLCHLLENNPNYTTDFRALGMDILTGKNTSFQQAFGSRREELTFEYDLFLQHLASGYRVDLCSWDWKRKFLGIKSGRSISASVQAGRGWQPSSAIVAAKSTYEYAATGTWRPGKKAELVGADGMSDGVGRLVGVVMKDYQLSEEFELGESGSFTAPSDGNLYLRCRTPWNKLPDSAGKITVKFKLKTPVAESSNEK